MSTIIGESVQHVHYSHLIRSRADRTRLAYTTSADLEPSYEYNHRGIEEEGRSKAEV